MAKTPRPLHDPPEPPPNDPPTQPLRDPPGDPTYEPPQPSTDPTPNPAGDPPRELPRGMASLITGRRPAMARVGRAPALFHLSLNLGRAFLCGSGDGCDKALSATLLSEGEGFMRTAIACGALALSIMMAGAAEVDTESANYVLPGCKALLALTEGREMLDTSRALGAGYCMGVLKTLPEIYFARDRCSIQFPEVFSVQQMTLIVVRYIEAHPDRKHMPFLMLAEDALQDAWPCRN